MQSIRKRDFTGANGSRFVQLFFPRHQMTMMIREQDLVGTVRRPIAKKTAREVLAHIGSWHGRVSQQWKTREGALQKKLDDGDPFALAEVYKILRLRQQADTLSAADRRQLSQCETRLSEELAMAFGLAPEKVLQRMETSALG